MHPEPSRYGSPCWIQIPSENINRAKQFYSEVFDWKFHPASEEHPADRVALFSFPDPKLSMLGGGIVKQKDKIQRGGVVYLYVNDIDLTVARLAEAGGKEIGKPEPEGPGLIQHFEDTEGNFCGMYMAKANVGK